MKPSNSARAITIALLGGMTIPVATQRLTQGQIVRSEGDYALFRSQDDNGRFAEGEDIRKNVRSYQITARAKRRAYKRAVDRCMDLRRTQKDLVCPDINDPSTFNFEDQPVHEAAPVEEKKKVERTSTPRRTVSRSAVRDLSTSERELLRTNTRAGFCCRS